MSAIFERRALLLLRPFLFDFVEFFEERLPGVFVQGPENLVGEVEPDVRLSVDSEVHRESAAATLAS